MILEGGLDLETNWIKKHPANRFGKKALSYFPISFALSFSSSRSHLGPPVGGGTDIARALASSACGSVASPAGMVVDGGASAHFLDPMASPPKRPARGAT